MPRKKLRKIIESQSLPNILHAVDGIERNWLYTVFPEPRPLVVELGCGHGDFIIFLAENNPGKNFVGVDLKGSRLWKGARHALAQELHNVVFLRAPVSALHDYFAVGEVSEIWINFPDPFPKRRHIKKRLTELSHLRRYRTVLEPGGRVHLKTDNTDFFAFTLDILRKQGLEVVAQTTDLYAEPPQNPVLLFQSRYERRFLAEGKRICYVCFKLDGLPPYEKSPD